MFKITGAPCALHFPLDKFTLPIGDSEHKDIPPRVLGRLRNMHALKQLKLDESSDDEPKKDDKPKAPREHPPAMRTPPSTKG